MAQELETDLTSSAASSALPKMTYEEFLDWVEPGKMAEWVDGEVILMSPVSTKHQLLANFLTALLQHFVEARDLGVVLTAPYQMRIAFRPSGREPDVIFIAREHEQLLTNAFLDGPADLAIEVVSPDSVRRDREDKYYEYQRAGVREYWIVDPLSKQADFFQRNAEGVFTPMPVVNGIFNSTVLPGLWLKVDWLWQEPLPTLMSVLKYWGLVKE